MKTLIINKEARNKTLNMNNISFAESARQCWLSILQSLPPDSRVLLPAYIGFSPREGSGIYDPVKESSVSHDFYLLSDKLTINIDVIEKLITLKKYKLILVVHYFGITDPAVQELAQLCKKHDIILVEDCAHLFNYTLQDWSPAGTYGDYCIYSLHKYFPMESGGMLVQRRKCKLNSLQHNKNYDYYAHQVLQFDFKSIAAVRRRNFMILEEQLAGVCGLQAFATLKISDIPNNFPVLLAQNDREQLYFWLREHQIITMALYYQLVEPLRAEEYSSMIGISKRILNLPIHQDLEAEDMFYIAENVKRGLKEIMLR